MKANLPLVASSLAYRMCPAESVICKRDNEGKKHSTLLLWAHAACAARVIPASTLDLLLSPFSSFPLSLWLHHFLLFSSTQQELTVSMEYLLTLRSKIPPTNQKITTPPKKPPKSNWPTNKKKNPKLKPTLISLPPMNPKYRLNVRTIAEPNCLYCLYFASKIHKFPLQQR